jgi:hypothetical protein
MRGRLATAAACALLGAVAAACFGSSSAASRGTGTTSPATSVQPGWDTITTPSRLAVRYPPAWYGQTYDGASATVLSFPIHQPDRAIEEKPPAGALVIVLDTPPASLAARYLPPRPRTRLRLEDFQPNYEMFGAAYRIEFHDRGHDVLVFVSFGQRASTVTRQEAIAVLNSVRAIRGALPPPRERQAVTLHLGNGRRTVSTPVVYPHYGQTFSITTTKPAAARLTGYLDAGGSHLAGIAFACPRKRQTICRAGPFNGIERGAVPRVWYLHVAKRSAAPASVHIIIQFG